MTNSPSPDHPACDPGGEAPSRLLIFVAAPAVLPCVGVHRLGVAHQEDRAPETPGRFSTAGPVVAATVIGGIRDVSGLPDQDHFAAHNGTASAEGVL
jgi:hypothetical protein